MPSKSCQKRVGTGHNEMICFDLCYLSFCEFLDADANSWDIGGLQDFDSLEFNVELVYPERSSFSNLTCMRVEKVSLFPLP